MGDDPLSAERRRDGANCTGQPRQRVPARARLHITPRWRRNRLYTAPRWHELAIVPRAAQRRCETRSGKKQWTVCTNRTWTSTHDKIQVSEDIDL